MNYLLIAFIILVFILIVVLIIQCFIKDSFNNNYKKNVYISMTTIPERLKTEWWFNNLKRNMSFLNNNQAIIINIPYISLKDEKYIIPKSIIKLKNENPTQLIINRVDLDEGPITKLLPTLRNNNIKDNDTIIIVDDDLYYKPNVFKLIEQGVNVYPNKISSMCGEMYYGFMGTGFKKKLMKNILNFNYPKSCIKIDDEIIRFFIYKNNIKYNKVLYNNISNGYCSILPNETDKERPNWYELNKDNRFLNTLKCRNDLKNMF